MMGRYFAVVLLSISSVASNANPTTGLPVSIYDARSANSGPDPTRYASYEEMAVDPEIQRLFKQWLGVGVNYVNRVGHWKRDVSMTRAHSLTGLRASNNKSANCQKTYGGQSGFTRYGQARDVSPPMANSISERGGAWPAFDVVSPLQQAKYEGYCELFNQLAPYWVALGLLEQ